MIPSVSFSSSLAPCGWARAMRNSNKSLGSCITAEGVMGCAWSMDTSMECGNVGMNICARNLLGRRDTWRTWNSWKFPFQGIFQLGNDRVLKVPSGPDQSGIPWISPFSKANLFGPGRDHPQELVMFTLEMDLPPPRNFPAPPRSSQLCYPWIPSFPSFWEREESISTLPHFLTVLI